MALQKLSSDPKFKFKTREIHKSREQASNLDLMSKLPETRSSLLDNAKPHFGIFVRTQDIAGALVQATCRLRVRCTLEAKSEAETVPKPAFKQCPGSAKPEF